MTGYNEILTAMQEKYYAQTGFFADDASDIGIRLKVLALQLASLAEKISGLEEQVFPQTAHGNELDYHAETRGLHRKEAASALGTLRFSRSTPAPEDLIIPMGTMCAVSRGDDGVELRFKTTAAATLAKGAVFADAAATATDGGTLTNVAPNTITVIMTPVQGVSSVTNTASFNGGADAENDTELRARLLRSFGQISNGTNSAFYYDFVMGFEGIASAKVVPRVAGRGTVGVYVAGQGTAAPDALIQKIKTQITAAKEINVDVTVKSALLRRVNVSLELDGKSGADFENLKIACHEKLKAYFLKLSVGQSLLIAGISDALYHVEGLYNYKLSAPTADTPANADELLILGTVTINRMAVIS
ncbi:MAG: baseplate J/gp47 family protein [Hydrogenoanaerobacterium sp.]